MIPKKIVSQKIIGVEVQIEYSYPTTGREFIKASEYANREKKEIRINLINIWLLALSDEKKT